MKLPHIKRYDAYQDSGMEWLGEVPAHWERGRIKDFVNTNMVTPVPVNMVDTDLVAFIPMSNINEVLGKIEKFNFVPLKEVSSGYSKFKNRDVIFAKITPCMENGNCAIVSDLLNDICFGSTEFMVFRTHKMLNEKYLHYYFHNDLFRLNAEPFMRGTAGQKRISSLFMVTHFLALPPCPEQQAIAAYLDTKTTQLDRQIELLGQKAEQYGKLKQSLINETVTRGLDKTVAMKDSGVAWISEVPAHWEVKRLKEIARVQTGNTPPKDIKENYSDTGCLFVKPDELFELLPTYDSKEKISFAGRAFANPVPKDSVLVCCIGSIGKLGIAGCEIATNQQINALVFNRYVLPAFAKFMIFASKDEHLRNSAGNVVAILSMEKQKRILFAVPALSEQAAIAAYLDTKTAHIDRIITTLNRQIATLKELRKTLINEVVTGKICIIEQTEKSLTHAEGK